MYIVSEVLFMTEDFTTKVIGAVKFSIFSPEIIRKVSAAKRITVPDTYDEDSYPIDGGLVDQRLGVIDPGLKCKTCGGGVGTCPGHFGHIELVRPVIHPEFAKYLLYIMKATCRSCKLLLLDADEKNDLIKLIEEEGETVLKPQIKRKNCPHCGEAIPELTLMRPTTFFKDKSVMLPTEIRNWLEGISNDDLRLLGFDPLYARPEWMVLTVLLVPPVNVRPSITLETGERSEDDLTHKLVDVIRTNQRLDANINAGAPQLIIEDLWELLQYHITTYFNNEMSNIPPARHRSGRALKTLSQRLKGKEGRFRYNLSGKRVNFSARTVISPDPNISLDEVGVPMAIAKELTVPMRITQWNLERCRQFILNLTYPHADYIVRPDGKRVRVNETNRVEVSSQLAPGWIIDRQLIDGDLVLFNRQPSLHRISIMCHEVRVMPGKTLRLNPLDCPPYNADFDGDEMNLHAIQTEEAQVEADVLMKVHRQILSPRHGKAIIKPQEDHVTGAFYMTNDDCEFTKSEASDLLAIAGITKLPKPDRSDKYSGRLLFSLLLPAELSLKMRTKLGEELVIENGLLIKGSIESKAFENQILERIVEQVGYERAKWFLDSATRITLEVLTRHGLSVSLRNYSVEGEAHTQLNSLLDKTNREIDAYILQFKNKTLQKNPGLTPRETLEEKIMEITSKARDASGALVEKSFGKVNTAILMAKIGARGSLLNAVQMSAMLGQQAVRGKRLKRGYRKRLLPHFKRGVIGGMERGFITGSFKTGLKPYEYFQHSMGGRESLVNTAIRTARSGYMQRRLVNAFQDVVVRKDGTVRDARDIIVQFKYGGGGLDFYSNPAELLEKKIAVEDEG
ncbi:DNA-directed RNA polymerase subunit A' [Candidatus Micrarchaeota archaeon CG06_land_8_20_14_3_00_50_6]|nr:MAG: DNA-directed RNA polymerase subunit A' [Candidatus Micrarchaeota archaeon CG06_land_8_20_14_3_00_50_6]